MRAIGQTVYVKGVPFEIVGVTASSFIGVEGRPTDLWIPLQDRLDLNAWGAKGDELYRAPRWWRLPLIGRLAPGVSEASALARLQPVLFHAAYAPISGKPHPGEAPIVLSFAPAKGVAETDEFRKPIRILMTMVGFVLLIACGNVSLLILARNAALGLILAMAATKALSAWSDIETSLAPDGSVLAFTLGTSLMAALLFGLIPMVSTSRIPIGLALKTSASTAFRDEGMQRSGNAVAALQIALCLVILVGGGLLLGTLRNLQAEKLGIRAEGLLVFGISPPGQTAASGGADRFYQVLLARLEAIPGVEGVTLMGNRIGGGWSNNTEAVVDGKVPTGGAGMRWNTVGSDYFAVLGTPLLRGRDIRETDNAAGPKVAVVNATFAKKFFGDRDPLGHQVSFSEKIPFTVIGVAGDSKYTSVRETKRPMAFFPAVQLEDGLGDMHVELRTAGDPMRMLPVVRKAVAEIAPDAALVQPMTQRAQFDQSISDDRLLANLAMAFGGLALVLVATGLYGSIAYSVTRRTSEVGIRMALGAQGGEVLWMVLRESLVGLAAGLPFAFLLARLMGSMLYGMRAYDPITVGVALACIAAVSLLASFLPARRAANIEPLVALRYE